MVSLKLSKDDEPDNNTAKRKKLETKPCINPSSRRVISKLKTSRLCHNVYQKF